MKTKKPVPEVDEEFIKAGFEMYRRGQEHSLLWTISHWSNASPTPFPCLLVNTDALFPRISNLEPKAAQFLPEVYACVDQLLMALVSAAAEMHRAAEAQSDAEEQGRVEAVAELLKCVATQVYSIRVLAHTGFEVQVNQLVRTYVEYLELLALVCADSIALDEFIKSDNSDEPNAFWHRYLSKNKARKKRYANSVLKAGLPPEEQERGARWHGEQAKLMSECAHPSIGAVLRSGRISLAPPFILPSDCELVIGPLMYTFSVFSDTLELPTLNFLRDKLKILEGGQDQDDEAYEVATCKRFYFLFLLSVMLGYRKDYVFFGKSNIDEDVEAALKGANNAKRPEAKA